MSAPTIDLSARPRPNRGLIDLTVLGIELRRVLRNRRTMIFMVVFPPVMFLFISAQITGKDDVMGPGIIANVGAYVMVSMALYGAVLATTSAGASVSIERASGWSRQLRLTPLNPVAYVTMKMISALVLGAIATGVTFAVGSATGHAHMAARTWAECAVIIVVGSLVFAAFGLFMGYLLPSDNVMQFIGPVLAILSIFGGIFTGPISTDSLYGRIAELTPIYGFAAIAHWPLTVTTSGGYDAFEVGWLVNLVAWAAIFVAGAVWRFRKDTARV